MGSGPEASKHGLRRHVGVFRHMPGEDSEDTWVSEDTFPASRSENTWASKDTLAKAFAGVKPCECEKTSAVDRSGGGKQRREDTS